MSYDPRAYYTLAQQESTLLPPGQSIAPEIETSIDLLEQTKQLLVAARSDLKHSALAAIGEIEVTISLMKANLEAQPGGAPPAPPSARARSRNATHGAPPHQKGPAE